MYRYCDRMIMRPFQYLPGEHFPRCPPGQFLILRHVQAALNVVVIMFCYSSPGGQTLSQNISRLQVSLLGGFSEPIHAEFGILLFVDFQFCSEIHNYRRDKVTNCYNPSPIPTASLLQKLFGKNDLRFWTTIFRQLGPQPAKRPSRSV